jgi:hypothetical protein
VWLVGVGRHLRTRGATAMQRSALPQSASVRHSASAVHEVMQARWKAGCATKDAQGGSQPRRAQPVRSASASAPSSSGIVGAGERTAGWAEAHPTATSARAASPTARARCSSSRQPESANKTMATARIMAYEHRRLVQEAVCG